tara:strand:+ start:1334 stop:1582 length:249 start_codon:yes stop_codon:yes gene_type:complete
MRNYEREHEDKQRRIREILKGEEEKRISIDNSIKYSHIEDKVGDVIQYKKDIENVEYEPTDRQLRQIEKVYTPWVESEEDLT